ncbi:MAG: glycerophosphodiester phosphodiesterase [Solirubrobacteraceae bacterium]
MPASAGAAEPLGPVLNVAHRGASGHAPEHTFAAYDLALWMGADYIEQDLQLTSDGVLVALHDETLDRTARGPAVNCTGRVDTKTLAQIKTCEVGSWFSPEFAGEPIPTLEEVFRRYRRRTNYYIETKSPDTADRMEERLLALMDEYGLVRPAQQRWQVLIQSFSPASLQRIHALNPRLPLIQLYPNLGSAAIQASLDAGRAYAVGIGPSKASVDEALLDAAHDRCLAVHPYTLVDRDEHARFVELGVDGAFSNFLDVFETVLDRDAIHGRRAAELAAAAFDRCAA